MPSQSLDGVKNSLENGKEKVKDHLEENQERKIDRRTLLKGMGVAAAGIGTVLSGSGTASAANSYNEFNISGYHHSVDAQGPAENLVEEWTKDVPSAAGDPVSNGETIFIPQGSQLQAYDIETGEEKWSKPFQAKDNIGTPTIEDGKIYFGDGINGYGVDTETGKKLFTLKDDSTTPFVPTDNGIAHGIENGIEVVDKDTGDQLQKIKTEGNVVVSSVNYDSSENNLVFLDQGDYSINVYDLDQGEMAKNLKIKGDPIFNAGATLSGDGYIFTTTDGVTREVDLNTMNIQWSIQTGPENVKPIVDGKHTYIVGGYSDPVVSKIDRGSGSKEWTTQLEGKGAQTTSAGENVLYVGRSDELDILSKEDGKLIKEYKKGISDAVKGPAILESSSGKNMAIFSAPNITALSGDPLDGDKGNSIVDRYDTDNSGGIEKGEIRTAIIDFVQNKITKSQLRKIILEYVNN